MNRSMNSIPIPSIQKKFILLIATLLLPLHNIFVYSTATSTHQCHSCLAQCKLLPDGRPNPTKCDCGTAEENTSEGEDGGGTNDVNGMEMCMGQSCFVKLELFPDESVAIVQKGCAQGLPQDTEGCNFSGQTESIHCYCQGPFCNERKKLNDYLPVAFPVLECCECGHDEECPGKGCARNCRGNYCLVDFGSNEQGCGHGVPRLQNFLRIPNYLGHLQGQMVCAHYQASIETVVNGCVCTEPSGICNQLNRTWEHQMNSVLTRRVDDLNYCYSLHAHSEDKPLTAAVYKKAATCEGHFCFASMSTREMAVEPDSAEPDPESVTNFVGVSKERFELLGGCLKVDDDEKVSLGCTVEYAQNSSEPLSIHCICDSHLCNYHDLLLKATNATAMAEFQSTQRVRSSEIHRDTFSSSSSSSSSSLQEIQLMDGNSVSKGFPLHSHLTFTFPSISLFFFIIISTFHC